MVRGAGAGHKGNMAAVGHWCNHAAGLVASSLKAIAPEQTAMRWRPAFWSGTVLAARDRGS